MRCLSRAGVWVERVTVSHLGGPSVVARSRQKETRSPGCSQLVHSTTRLSWPFSASLVMFYSLCQPRSEHVWFFSLT